MEPFIATLVVLIQLMLAGFVIWGGGLVFWDWLRGSRAEAAKTRADGFERVVSLVLLALLCTTLAAV